MKNIRLIVSVPENIVQDLLLKLQSEESTIDLKFRLQDIAAIKHEVLKKKKKEVMKQGNTRRYLQHKRNLPPEVFDIIEYWNNSKFITYAKKHRELERRNFSISCDKIGIDFAKIIKRAIISIGADKIKEEMNNYFIACEKGEHIWDTTNHGFKNVVGFLTKLLALHKTGGSAWWERPVIIIDDDDPRVTQMLADLYAVKFLGKNTYTYETNSKEHTYFIKFRKILKKRMKKNNNIKAAADLVFTALHEQFTVIQPKQLCSRNTWTIIIPQYLKKLS